MTLSMKPSVRSANVHIGDVCIERFDEEHEEQESRVSLARFYQALDVKQWSVPDAPELAVILWHLTRRHATAAWVARETGGRTVGDATVTWPDPDRHSVALSVRVDPAFRRAGLGTTLLRVVAGYATDVGASRLHGRTLSIAPEGTEFATRLGAKAGIDDACTQQLDVRHLNRAVLDSVLEGTRLCKMELRTIVGPYDDRHIATVAVMKGCVRVAYGRPSASDEITSAVASLREFEQKLAADGYERWATYAVDPTTSTLVGYAEALWATGDPKILWGHGTAVAESHRHRRIGSLMQATLLTDVLRARPAIRYARLTNREPGMIKHNHELGYRVSYSYTRWDLMVADLLSRITPVE